MVSLGVLFRLDAKAEFKPMSCKACGSADQRKFLTEINIHPPPRGLKNMDKPTVWASPTILVCSNCGFAEFVLKDEERKSLEENYRETWANGREFSA
jgi:predicted nucleic-acid-binding Zn-ribbon protein